jgi:hypothetical protein
MHVAFQRGEVNEPLSQDCSDSSAAGFERLSSIFAGRGDFRELWKELKRSVLVKRQGTSPILTVQLKASEADTEARELHREILRVLSDGYEERFFPLKKDGDNRINQTIWCTVVVASDLVASSIEVRCGRRFPRQIFVGLTDAGIGTSEFSAVAKRLPAMIDELYNLATKLPDN